MTTISLAPNTAARDARRAAALLLRPWLWREGAATVKLEQRFSAMFGGLAAQAVVSGRFGLYTLLRALRLPSPAEVLLQAYTCVSVPGPVLWAGLLPVYVDIDVATLTMDPQDLRRKITPRSRVLIVQHTFGCPAQVGELCAIAQEHGLTVIEDCAHSIGGAVDGRPLGTFGDAALFSFGRDKVISSVFGGMIVVSHPEKFPGLSGELAGRARANRRWIVQQLLHPLLFSTIIRPLYFFAGAGKFLLVVLQTLGVLSKALTAEEKRGGFPAFRSTLLPNALAELALDQLERLPEFNARRRAASRTYAAALAGTRAVLPPSATGVAYLRYTLQTPRAREIRRRARRARLLLGDWYDTVIAPRGTDLAAVGYFPGSCPRAEEAAEQSLNLPTHPLLSDRDVENVIGFVTPFLR